MTTQRPSNALTEVEQPTTHTARKPIPRWLQWLVMDDPAPETSRLDRMDGLG